MSSRGSHARSTFHRNKLLISRGVTSSIPNNFFQALLIDFGCACEVREEYTSFCGTSEYYPPEWYRHGRYAPGPLCVWQLGCLLYILLTGAIPFEKEDIREAKRATKYEKHLSYDALEAINAMLEPEESKRVKLDDLDKLSFFKS